MKRQKKEINREEYKRRNFMQDEMAKKNEKKGKN